MYINENVMIEFLNQQIVDDAKFEFETAQIKFIEEKQKSSTSNSYKFQIQHFKETLNVLITYNTATKKIGGFCQCEICKTKNVCIHLGLAVLKINEIKAKEKSALKAKDSDVFRISQLKNVYMHQKTEDLITFNLHIKPTSDNYLIHLHVAILGQKSYKIKDINAFVKLIVENKKIKLGTEFNTQNYKIEPSSYKLFEKLLVLQSIKAQNMGLIDNFELSTILKSLINQDVVYENVIYTIREKIDEIVVEVKEQKTGTILEFKKCDHYQKINDTLVINAPNKIIYVLEQNQMQKIELINSFQTPQKQITIDQNHIKEFNDNILPNIFNEFDVHLSDNTNLKIIEEKMTPTMYCYLENKIIHIRPRFKYGNYYTDESYPNLLIKRSFKAENEIVKVLIDNGYVYDYYKHEFIIEAEHKQFHFLSKNIFTLKQDLEIFLDNKLEDAILNFNSNSVKISITSNSDNDFFALDVDLDQIKMTDIDPIIKSIKAKKDFHMLDSNKFIKLNDNKLLSQLLFLKDLNPDNEEISNFKVPKYRAIYMDDMVNGLFSKTNVSEDFNDYITSLKEIKPLSEKSFKSDNYILRDYQKTAVNWLSTLHDASLGALLCDEMGLGKTLQTLVFLNLKKLNNTLIVVPKALLYNWESEVKKYVPNMICTIIDGDVKKRSELISQSINTSIIVTSYHSLINDIDNYIDHTFDAIVLDEAQYIKNPETKITKSVKQLKGSFYLALTGTPIENNLTELWSLFDFIIPGYLSNLKTFNQTYLQKQSENQVYLKKIIQPFILRRLKKQVLQELPDKIEQVVYCEMQDAQKQLYVSFVKQYQQEINMYVNAKNLQNNMQIIAAITRLRQLAIEPKLFVENYQEESAKLEVFKELVKESIENNQKIVIFSQFTSLLAILKKELDAQDIKYYYLDGKTRPKDRMMDVERFNKNKIPVYLISLKAGGVGLNLTSASNVIIYDPWWNPAVENQAIDRLHRIGQKNTVNVYKLVTRHTIEEKIDLIKIDKNLLLDDITNQDEVLLNQLKHADLINLLVHD